MQEVPSESIEEALPPLPQADQPGEEPEVPQNRGDSRVSLLPALQPR
jgi:hypothetical protein